MEARLPLQGRVTKPTVRAHHTPRSNRLLDKGEKALCGGVGDLPHSNPSHARSIFLICNKDEGLGSKVPTTQALLPLMGEGSRGQSP